MRLFILQFLQFLFWLFFSELCLYVTNLSLYLVIQIFFSSELAVYILQFWVYILLFSFFSQFWVCISQFRFFFLRIGDLYLAFVSLFFNSEFFLTILSLYLAILNYCLSDLSLYLNSEFFLSELWAYHNYISRFFLSILSRVAKSWKISSKFRKLSGIFGNLPGFLESFRKFTGNFPPICNPNSEFVCLLLFFFAILSLCISILICSRNSDFFLETLTLYLAILQLVYIKVWIKVWIVRYKLIVREKL